MFSVIAAAVNSVVVGAFRSSVVVAVADVAAGVTSLLRLRCSWYLLKVVVGNSVVIISSSSLLVEASALAVVVVAAAVWLVCNDVVAVW